MIKTEYLTKSRPLFLLLILGVFTLGAISWHIFSPAKAERCADYFWLNYQLRCQDKPVINKAAYTALKNDFIDDIENWKKEGLVDEMSVYFRDLQNGPYFGINADVQFIPASLLKVPLMITYLRLAEDDPELLKHELVYGGDSDKDELFQNTSPVETLESGKSYSVREMMRKMIIYSDNRSWFALRAHLWDISPEEDQLVKTYIDLGIIEKTGLNDEFISPRLYSSIFRILYNSSYLSKESSDEALGYLSQSRFTEGLRAGVPASIFIAHKFGERAIDERRGQIHDCGIVYYPENSYLLCVMTEGENFKKATDLIKNISERIYEEVDLRRN